ncbi:MAG: menaquinone biosynthesis protein [Gemmatimonadota bacterium]
MIALGHIAYANCFPVHGPILLGEEPFEGEIVSGEPTRLNRLLAAGRVQIAPCSSIEYARHASRYRIVPDLAIASHGDVRSILLASRVEPDRLGHARVGLPTASASSSCLAEILLTRAFGATPELGWFDQSAEDPFGRFDAALFIGDVALGKRAELGEGLCWTDLGGAWTAWTGLPFVYALWQVHAQPGLEEALREAGAALHRSRARALADLEALAARYSEPFPLGRDALAGYWAELRYTLDRDAREGLAAFWTMAAELGHVRRAPALRYLELEPSAVSV